MNFKEIFLQLTQTTIPHGYEKTIEHLLPDGVIKDEIGNYFITIGENSTTLFTSHLDTVSTAFRKINHVIENNFIKTDGTTTLGGDNKAGVCILMYLIEQKVSGTYYFFVGEECGCIGSRWALKNDLDYFKQFKRAVAFDRRETGSIITHQRGSRCCSEIFSKALSIEFDKQGLKYQSDDNGVFTDSAVFMEVIPEITNLSSGVYREHSVKEYIDIEYTENVAIASALIDWENLPVVREIFNLKFARRCSHTGEGMNEGYVFGDGEYYASTKDIALQYATEIGFETLEDAYNSDAYYYTEWEDENDYQFELQEDGSLKEIE